MELNDKQKTILESAEKLFATKGYFGTSVRDIANNAGVNVAMISYYFGSKEKMLETLIVNRMDAQNKVLETIASNEKLKPFQKIEQLIDAYVTKLFLSQGFHKLIIREFVVEQIDNLKTTYTNHSLRNLAIVKRIVNEGQKENLFLKNVDIPLMFSTLIGTIHHTLSTKLSYKKYHHLEAKPAEEIDNTLANGLKKHLKKILKAFLTHEQ